MPTREFQASPTVAFPFDDILHDVLAAFSGEAERKAISLELVANDLAGVTLLGDPKGLHEVLTRLCDQAVIATDHGHVHFVIETLPARTGQILARLAITDTGSGEVRDVAAVKTQVAAMGGELFVSATPGRGSTVFVIMPFIRHSAG